MNRRRFFTTAGAAAATAALATKVSSAAGAPGGGEDRIQSALRERKGSLKGLPEPLSLPRRTAAGLEPWVPTPQNPWDRRHAVYLLRRTMFGAKKSDVDFALTKTPGEVVDLLLADKPLPAEPGAWVNSNYVYDNGDNNDKENNDNLNALRLWWTGLIVNQDFSIREKLTLFWHDHWATETDVVNQPQWNYWFIDLFRRNVLGNFKQMVKDVTISPCMLVYLDGRYNVKGRPNENYARELMELHTLGEGNGYTEDDVKAGARCLTGWTIKSLGKLPNGKTQWDPKVAVFNSAQWDTGSKTFLGRTGNWAYGDVVDIIFSERESEVAKYICRKLYREFVYEIADETIITQMAALLVQNAWDLRPVLTTLLKSAHFFDKANIGAHITSPYEYFVGAIRALEIQTTAWSDIYTATAALGLQLLLPPNVKGWPAYRSWISASRLASRWGATDALIDDGKKPTPKFPFDPVAWVTRISTPSDAHKITQDVIELFYDIPLNAYQTDVLLNKFLSGWRDYEWDIANPGAVERIRGLLKAVLRNSEAQLI